MSRWFESAVFYHIYPLGLCGAPERNTFQAAPQERLNYLYSWIDHLEELGVNALYLGPIFEASAHGYDTADYFHVDRRLGTNSSFSNLVKAFHGKGIKVILDGVFHHVGRDFWAFRDVIENGESSPYRWWFSGIDFQGRSPFQDPFSYECWNGNYDLVKLNLNHAPVVEHLLEAVSMWINEFHIDGLRLDVADSLDLSFQSRLSAFCKQQKEDFWMMGEVIQGDYRRWANPSHLDSVTNYECFKGLYSSHVEKNYFELAYALNRQYGPEGIYRDFQLYNFADNHDVNRVASNLSSPFHLYPLYCLLFAMPGIPSIYCGSEWGIEGTRTADSDRLLRPAIQLQDIDLHSPHPELKETIAKLAFLRRRSPALQTGDYLPLFTRHQQLGFARRTGEEQIVVMVNSEPTTVPFEVNIPGVHDGEGIDLLNSGERFTIRNGNMQGDLHPCWGRFIQLN